MRTGVTAILPRGRAGRRPAVRGGLVLAQRQRRDDRHHLDRGGRRLQSAVVLSNTHAVGACHTGMVELGQPRSTRGWPGSGCCPCRRDLGRLPQRHQRRARPARARGAALDAATSAARSPKGSVGGGTGMNCYGFKGGTGTASRVVGYGRRIHRRRVRAGQLRLPRAELTVCRTRRCRPGELLDDNPLASDWFDGRPRRSAPPPGAGLGHRRRRHRRPAAARPVQGPRPAGPAGPGPHRHAGGHFSGDIFLAFSTAERRA